MRDLILETDESLKNNIETKIKNTPLGMFNYIKDKAKKEAVDRKGVKLFLKSLEDSEVVEDER